MLAEADFVGSTAEMIDYVGDRKPPRVVLVTECSMSDNVARRVPDDRVRAAVQPLPAHEADHAAKILHSLETMSTRSRSTPTWPRAPPGGRADARRGVTGRA